MGLALFCATPAIAERSDDWRGGVLQEYAALLALPNVAANVADIRRNASMITAMMAKRGLSPRLLEGATRSVPPAIYGEWRVPGAKHTIVFYAHYDGQPVDPSDWKSTRPFEPKLFTGRFDKGGQMVAPPWPSDRLQPDWRLYARSASDDKLGVMAILAAIDRLKARKALPAFNLKIFFEGEEEAGSPHLAEILQKHRNLLGSDGWVIIDGPGHPSGVPQVALGVRGDVNVDLIVYGPVRPLHSGHYGNWAPNPALALSRLLASMKDDDGRVTVAGFYDDVAPLSASDRRALAEAPSADIALRDELALPRPDGGGRPLLGLLMEPSLNINGISAGGVGEQARNVIPASASATLDLRLVAGNDARRQVGRLIRHVEAQGFKVLDRPPTLDERRQWPRIATMTARPGYNAERTSLDHPLARSVVSALGRGRPIVVLPSVGGSLPLYIFRQTLGAPTVTVSFANHDNNQHAEDENLRLGNLWTAIDGTADLLQLKWQGSTH